MDKQTHAFDRPALYWLHRAERARREGDMLRAAVMERHAARTQPESPVAARRYAATLRRMGCLEASTREVFAALAYDSARWELLGTLSLNWLDAGKKQDALSAMTLFLDNAEIDPLELDSWDEEYRVLCGDMRAPGYAKKARLRGLSELCLRRLARGDAEGAGRAIFRAYRQYAHVGVYPYRELARAVYHHVTGAPGPARAFILGALARHPGSVSLNATAAVILHEQGERSHGLRLLVRAAFLAWSQADEANVLQAAARMQRLDIAMGMLTHILSEKPNRFFTVYNAAVCLLRLGRPGEALRYAHLLREIDPDDLPGERLFSLVSSLSGNARPLGESLGFWGALSREEWRQCLAPLWEAMERPVEEWAPLIASNAAFRRRLIEAAGRDELPAGLLGRLAEALPSAEAQRLLRQALTAGPNNAMVKKEALAGLSAMGAPPPYFAWYPGRLVLLDPTKPPQLTPMFLTRRLFRCAVRVRRAAGEQAALYALQAFRRMNRAQRLNVAGDRRDAWPAALCVRYAALTGLPPPHAGQIDRAGASAMKKALHILRKGETKNGNHQL